MQPQLHFESALSLRRGYIYCTSFWTIRTPDSRWSDAIVGWSREGSRGVAAMPTGGNLLKRREEESMGIAEAAAIRGYLEPAPFSTRRSSPAAVRVPVW